ncbi:hypothetical protein LCGC14_1616520, partial [marine sediment metagenome]
MLAGLGKLLLKVSGKAGRELAEQTAKTVSKAAPEASIGLRGWWKSLFKGVRETAETGARSGGEVIESAAKHVDDIMKDLSDVRSI